MPKPRRSILSPTCPMCGHLLNRSGKSKAGYQRYRCRPCRFSCTDGPNTHGGHRHGAVGGTPAAELMRRSRERQKAKSSQNQE